MGSGVSCSSCPSCAGPEAFFCGEAGVVEAGGFVGVVFFGGLGRFLLMSCGSCLCILAQRARSSAHDNIHAQSATEVDQPFEANRFIAKVPSIRLVEI